MESACGTGSMARPILAEGIDDVRPLVFERSGPFLRTEAGRYLELAGGAHATCIVNDDGGIQRRIVERMRREPIPVLGRAVASPAQVELACKIVGAWGDPRARVYFVSGGTEGIETAVRLAHYTQALRGRPQAVKCIGRQNSYHGMSMLARAIGDHPLHSQLGALDPRWPKMPEPRCSDCPLSLRRETCALACAEMLHDIILQEGPDTVAAYVIEPVGGTTAGAVPAPEGYIERVREICRTHQVLLIADETITAFWRTGRAFCTPPAGADIVVGGKCLAAGITAIGAVILAGALVDELRVRNASLPLRLTFAGNPLACVVAAVVQEYVEESGLGIRVASNGSWIGEVLTARLSAAHNIDVHGQGHLWSIATRCRDLPEARLDFEKVRRRALAAGIEFMGGVRLGKNAAWRHFMLSPAFDCTPAELEACIDAACCLTLQ